MQQSPVLGAKRGVMEVRPRTTTNSNLTSGPTLHSQALILLRHSSMSKDSLSDAPFLKKSLLSLFGTVRSEQQLLGGDEAAEEDGGGLPRGAHGGAAEDGAGGGQGR